ncbi:hypothetical protein like AT3G59880 [Hibiscus trionum]|uniref:Uncharacterized protein n=1 Tax=Hibiscus trionum TaxID=183268 RepID=A0A9W7H665_HIBTR|nr:hypothetical protein like AT3G59880 [Hibiscus trionum]
MEGLIPLVYRTLKKTKTRRQYECLSSGAAQPYNIADFYVQSRSHIYVEPNNSSVAEKNIGSRSHRRRMSTGDISSSVEGLKITGVAPTPAGPKLTRFRSHRMFSCVTGC